MLPQPPYLNLEYFFYLLFKLVTEPWPFTPPVWLSLLWLTLIILLWLVIILLSYKIIRQRQRKSADLTLMLKTELAEKPERNERWGKVLRYLESENPAEWKQAINEADIMLDELVKNLPATGENLGERLKSIEPSDFLTLQEAWEAHKVRNQIVHESGFVLSKREALHVVGLFKKVFEEFNYI